MLPLNAKCLCLLSTDKAKPHEESTTDHFPHDDCRVGTMLNNM
jgi:hypothetical protein